MSFFFLENNPQSVSTLTCTNRYTKIHRQEKKEKKLFYSRSEQRLMNLITIFSKPSRIKKQKSLPNFTVCQLLLYCSRCKKKICLLPWTKRNAFLASSSKQVDREGVHMQASRSKSGTKHRFCCTRFNAQFQSSKNMSEVYRVNYIDKTSITSCDVVSAVFSTEVLFVAFRLNTQVKPEIKRKKKSKENGEEGFIRGMIPCSTFAIF